MSDDLTRAYLAGFMDGEGSIRIHRGPQHHTLVVSVGQNVRAPLELFKQRYGGAIVYRKPSIVAATGQPRRGSWDWRMAGPQCVLMLKDLLPFLIVKRGEAELAVWFQVNKSAWQHRPLWDVERAERDAFYLALRDLKRLPALAPIP